MLRTTRVYAGLLLLLVLITTGCNLARTSGVNTPPPLTNSEVTAVSTRPFGTYYPSVTPFNLTPPTPGGCTPPPTGWIAYTVETGDSLGDLAQATGTTVTNLVAVNCLTDANSITAGQTIYLPTEPVVG